MILAEDISPIKATLQAIINSFLCANFDAELFSRLYKYILRIVIPFHYYIMSTFEIKLSWCSQNDNFTTKTLP